MRLRNKTPVLEPGVPSNQRLADAIGALTGKPGVVQEHIHPAVAGEDVDSMPEANKVSRFMDDWFGHNEDLRFALERSPPMEVLGLRAGLIIELGSRVEKVAVPSQQPKLDDKSLKKAVDDCRDELLGVKKPDVTEWMKKEMHYLVLVNPSQHQGDRSRNPMLESCNFRVIRTDGRGPDDGVVEDVFKWNDLTVDTSSEPAKPKFTLAGVRRSTLAALEKKAAQS
ncbi:MAG: hypothetical protein ABH834_00630 [Candidatus Altiarchaeota archaeon]